MPRLSSAIFLHVFFLVAVVVGVAVSLPKAPKVRMARGSSWEITSVQKTLFPWGEHPAEANNLSGIAWMGTDRYALVSDKGGRILWGEVRVDPATGAILSAKILPQTARVKGGRDLEDVARTSDGRGLVVCDEEDASLARISPEWGTSAEQDPVGRNAWLFRDCRTNLSLESVASSADDAGYWTINEDALVRDGARAGLQATAAASSGAWLRLVKVDARFRPVRQWAYRSDPIPGGFPIPMMVSGVAGLMALPDGRLIVLERALGLQGFRIRLYLVDPGSTWPDAAAVADLSKADDVRPLAKALLYEWTGRANFEGITLGPELSNGDRLLLMVVDDGDRISVPGLWALRLRRTPAETAAIGGR